jgi:O-antigen/teichoic acid export membrane protein
VFRAHLTGLMFFLLPATAMVIALALPLQERILGVRWTGASLLIVLLTVGFLVEFVFNAIYFLLQALGAGARLYAVELTQYVTLIALVSVLSGPFGLMGIGASRIITGIVVVAAGLVAIAPEMRRIALQIAWPGLVLTVLAALAGAGARVCTMFVPNLAGLLLGAAAGGALFLALAWLLDQPLRIGVRACLGLFFPALAPKDGQRI